MLMPQTLLVFALLALTLAVYLNRFYTAKSTEVLVPQEIRRYQVYRVRVRRRPWLERSARRMARTLQR
jgi:hypothetical protein